MAVDGSGEAIEVLIRRIDVLRELDATPTEQRTLPERLDTSRSTVDRALRELERLGWVTRTSDGYIRTLAGRLAVAAYTEFEAANNTLTTASRALNHLDPETEIPVAVLRTAENVAVASNTTPRERLDIIRSYIEDATALRGALPELLDDRLLEPLTEATPHTNTVSLVLPESVAQAEQRARTHLSSLRENDAVELHLQSKPSNLGVLAATFPEHTTPTVLVALHDNEQTLQALIETSNPKTIEWAIEELADREAASTTYSSTTTEFLPDPLRQTAHDGAPTARTDTATNDRDALPNALTREGFVALTESYFEARTPAPPATTLSTGADIVDVNAGYTLRREYVAEDGTRQQLASVLQSELLDGKDMALLGPAASGKSTVCKQVAVDWQANKHGPVFYRSSTGGQRFSSVDALRSAIREADGTPLVVVEDAPRPNAASVFDVLADPPTTNVQFLVDARSDNWFDPPAAPESTPEGVRHHFTTYRMPSLDDRERTRLIEHVDHLVEDSLPAIDDVTAMLPEDTDEETPGEFVSVLHHLRRYVDTGGSMASDERHPTSLVATAQSLHEQLAREGGPGARIVGVHVAALIAAGLRPTEGLVYALAPAQDGPDVATIEDAVDILSGVMVFDPWESVEAVHELWAAQYLETACAQDGDERVREQFATAVTAIVELFETPERQATVQALTRTETPAVEAIVDDPQAWASSFIERLYQIGREHSRLAPLFGSSETEPFSLPEVCTTRDQLRVVQWRGDMQVTAGDYEAAIQEFDYLGELATRHDERWFLARSRERRGYAHERLGDFELARTLTERARRDYEAIEDTNGRAECLNGLGVIAWLEGDIEDAHNYLADASEAYAEVGDRKGQADCYNNRGIVARDQGDLDAAESYWQQSYELRREIDDHQNVIDTLINLGVAHRDRGNLEDALQRFRQALKQARELGGREYEAHSRRALANTLVRREADGDVQDALPHLKRALELNQQAGIRFAEGHVELGLATAHRKLGELTKAREHRDAAADAYDDAGDETDEAVVTAERGRIALADDDVETAVTHLSESVNMLEATDRTPKLPHIRVDLGRALIERGDYDTARKHLTTALETYEERGAEQYAAPVRELLAALDDEGVE